MPIVCRTSVKNSMAYRHIVECIQYHFQQGQNVLHCAAQNNHTEVMKFVLDSIENFKFNDVEKVGISGVQ